MSLNGILFVANFRQNAETLFFVLTFGLVGFTGFWSLFFDRTLQMKRSTKYQAQEKAKQKRERPQPRQLPPNGENSVKNRP